MTRSLFFVNVRVHNLPNCVKYATDHETEHVRVGTFPRPQQRALTDLQQLHFGRHRSARGDYIYRPNHINN